MTLAHRLAGLSRTPELSPTPAADTAGRRPVRADPIAEVKRSVRRALVDSLGPGLYDPHMTQTELESRVRETLQTVVEQEEITSYPNEVVVTKSVSPTGPVQPGDVVTFTIRYFNGTRTPAADLLLSDSLSGRLEYVAGSAKSDRPTNVTTVDNEAGSSIVRFEIPGPIPAGQSGTVTFQARVR